METLRSANPVAKAPMKVRLHVGHDLTTRIPILDAYVQRDRRVPLSRRPMWLSILQKGMGHDPIAIEATRGEQTVGVLCLAHVKSLLFGHFLVSLPYLNSGGVVADDSLACKALIDRAVSLTNELDVRYLELRHEDAHDHPSLGHRRSDKVHMRLGLPTTGAALWEQISAKVRNQVRKGQKYGFTVHWGGTDLLDEFFDIFSRNMRDLGTPTFGRNLFAAILETFPDKAEVCVLRDAGRAVAAALLIHGKGISEVPSASSLKAYNSSCANMLLYWNLLERSTERKQEIFDFGRSSENSPTFRFKRQWGATASPAEWQYCLRKGSIGDMRPDNPRYRTMIAVWKRLPVAVTRSLGPRIVRGIP